MVLNGLVHGRNIFLGAKVVKIYEIGKKIANLCYLFFTLILDIFITIFTFLSIGCSVVITQAIGAKDKALARKAIHQSLFLNSILGFICAIGILWQGEQILELMNVPNELMSQSTIYLYMLGICLFFDAVGIVLASIIRVYNRAYSVMFVTILMDGITVLGNYYALNYTQSELLGVGLSTIAGRVVAIAILIFMMYNNDMHTLSLIFALKGY